MFSIRKRLLLVLAVVLTVTTLCTSIAIYFSVQNEVDKLLDNSLKEVAASYRNGPALDFFRKPSSLGSDQNVVVQIYDPLTKTRFLSRDMSWLPIMDRTGFSDAQIENTTWRIYTTETALGQIVEVGQPKSIRSDIAFQVAKPVLLPLLIMMILTGLILWGTVSSGFSYLSTAAQAIAKRSPSSLRPLSLKGLPREIAPLVQALNHLLERLNDSISAQKRFASDAAHELRTPLTALTLQLQLARRAKDDQARQKYFAKLDEGIKRASRLVTQLLTMARLDPDNHEKTIMPLDLKSLCRSVAEDMGLIAAQKNISISSASQGSSLIMGDEDALRLLLNNLCDNAIRYTQEGGRIEIRTKVEHDTAVIEVADNGPGIPESERKRIFERFYRADGTKTIPGTGLGLAIVRRVAELHNGVPSVSDGLDGKGICFTITFPARPLNSKNIDLQ